MKSTSLLAMAAVSTVLAAALAQGCGGGYGGTSYQAPPPPPSSPTPGPVVHVNFFGNGNGSIPAGAPFNATVTGYTQQAHAQVMAFAPGEMITITNDDTVMHTINVHSSFPAMDTDTSASGTNVFADGYRSGLISPGSSVGPLMVTNTAGNLFVDCGVHYVDGMKDGIIVQVGATPGPEATPVSGGNCTGYGCGH